MSIPNQSICYKQNRKRRQVRKIQGKYISKESISMNGNNRLKFNIKFVDLEPRNSLIEYWSSQYANSSNSEMYYFYLSFFQNIGYTLFPFITAAILENSSSYYTVRKFKLMNSLSLVKPFPFARGL